MASSSEWGGDKPDAGRPAGLLEPFNQVFWVKTMVGKFCSAVAQLDRFPVMRFALCAITAFSLGTPSRAQPPLPNAVNATTASSSASAPIRVQASEGIVFGVERVQWEIQGPFSTATVYARLRNQSDRGLEARLSIPLPAHQRLQGYALDVNGRLQDAVVVERAKAREVFESIVRRRVDPALMEVDQGNVYHLRVFPVPAGGERRVKLVLSSLVPRQDCGWAHEWVMPMGSKGEIPLELMITQARTEVDSTGVSSVGSNPALKWEPQSQWVRKAKANLAAGQSVRVCESAPQGLVGFETVVGGHRMSLLEVPVAMGGRRPPPRVVEVVWDASLSAPKDRSKALALLQAYVHANPQAQVVVTVLRNKLVSNKFEPGAARWTEIQAYLKALVPDGATNIHGWKPAAQAQEVLFFSDVTHTWGLSEPAAVDLPVFVIDEEDRVDPAMAKFLAAKSGAPIRLRQVSLEQALKIIQSAETISPVLAGADSSWHFEARQGGSLVRRACQVTAAPEVSSAVASADGGSVTGAPKFRTPGGSWVLGNPQSAAGFWCGQWLLEDLQAAPLSHQSEIQRWGQALSIPTASTALLVLESLDDYVRYGIVPAQADEKVRNAVAKSKQMALSQRQRAQQAHMNRLERDWQDRREWWSNPSAWVTLQGHARGKPAGRREADNARPSSESTEARKQRALRDLHQMVEQLRQNAMPRHSLRATPAAPPASPSSPKDDEAAVPAGQLASEDDSAKSDHESVQGGPSRVRVELRAVESAESYAPRLAQAQSAKAVMKAYLDLRPDFERSPAFYADVAERLLALKETTLGVQVLSNLVELMPEQAQALRLVAYRLERLGEMDEARNLLEAVAARSPYEPQSWRDLALQRAAVNDCDGATAYALRVILEPWDDRFADISLIMLAELNEWLPRCKVAPDLTALPESLRANLPLGLRVVLRWDRNDTDIDLHITDPDKNTVYYGRPFSAQAGRLSRDCMSGYGPEEFILKNPKPGIYKIYAKYFDSNQSLLSRATNAELTVQTDFGSERKKERRIGARLLEGSGLILLGTVRVDPSGKPVTGLGEP